MLVKILKRMGVALFAAVLIFYFVYAVLYSRFNVLATEKVYSTTVSDSIYTDCIVLRDEKAITSTSDGFVSYLLNDGDKVRSGGTVAQIFDSHDETVNHLIKSRLTSELSMIESLNDSISGLSVGINVVENQITNLICEYNCALTSGEKSDIYDLRNELLYYVNERKILSGEEKDFKAREDILKAETSSMVSQTQQAKGVVTTSSAGLFSSYTDGYEDCIEYEKIEKMTIDDYQVLNKKTMASNTVGKVVTEFDWYIVCPVTSEEALKLEMCDEAMNITFTSSVSPTVSVKLASINQNNKKSIGVAIFKCDLMDSELINLRNEEIRIDLEYFDGLRVPKSAVHSIEDTIETVDEDGDTLLETKIIQGVYVKRVNELEFKEINIIYSSAGFVMCDPDPEKILSDYGTIQLYDDIVTQGADLYDGKVVR